jgi:hypothetical protein
MMTREPDRFDELRGLLEALCEETITPEQLARLEALILPDPEAEIYYIHYMQMQVDLLREFGVMSARPDVDSRGRTEWKVGSGVEAAHRAAATPDPRLSGRPRKHRSRLPWAIAAAACVMLLSTGGFFLGRRPERPADVAVADRKAPTPGTSDTGPIPAPGLLALLIKLDGVRWEPSDGPAPAEGSVLAARGLRLREGRATLSFFSGVTLTIEGPADLDLVSADRVFCRRGRLRVRAPKGAEGFVVATPDSAVVDLGTEFGLNVEGDGKARIMVFEGAAEAALLDALGSPKRTQLVVRSKAFEIDAHADRIKETVAEPSGYVAASSVTVPSLALSPGYSRAVLGAGPKAYWRFESMSDGAIPNAVPGGPALRVHGAVTVADRPRGNGCALFPPGHPDQFLTIDDLWELAHTPGHAVEFWFMPEGFSRAMLVGLYPPVEALPENAYRYVHTLLVETTAQERQSLYRPASIRFLLRWPFNTAAGDNAFSRDVYVPRRWHHVVAQRDRDQLELYVNGVLGCSMTLDPDHPTRSCHLVVGRRTTDFNDPRDVRPFVGRLDELALYDHPLSDEEIETHFRMANQLD